FSKWILLIGGKKRAFEVFVIKLYFKATLYRQNPQLAVIYVTHFVEEITKDIDYGFLLKNGKTFKQGSITEILNSHTLSSFFKRNVNITYHDERYALFLNEEKIAEK